MAKSIFRRSAKHIGDRGLRLTAEFEGTYLRPYNDPAGHATVGIGHLIHYGPVTDADRNGIWLKGQKKRGQLTVQEAWKLLRKDLRKRGSYEAAVRALTRRGVYLSQNQFDALVSFVYNCGPGAIGMVPQSNGSFVWNSNATGVARALYQRKQYPRGHAARDALLDAGNEMLRWDKAGGQTLAGLTRRRKAERALLLKR